MMINLCSKKDKHLSYVREALGLFNESCSGNLGAVLVIGGEHLKIQGSIKILCPFLGNLIDSLPLNILDDPVIIIPDCSLTAFKHMANVLTEGRTEDCHDVDAVVEVARVLNIAMEHNLVVEDQGIVEQQKELTAARIKVADFSRVFLLVPDLINHDNEEKEDTTTISCSDHEKKISTRTKLDRHQTKKHSKPIIVEKKPDDSGKKKVDKNTKTKLILKENGGEKSTMSFSREKKMVTAPISTESVEIKSKHHKDVNVANFLIHSKKVQKKSKQNQNKYVAEKSIENEKVKKKSKTNQVKKAAEEQSNKDGKVKKKCKSIQNKTAGIQSIENKKVEKKRKKILDKSNEPFQKEDSAKQILKAGTININGVEVEISLAKSLGLK